MHVSIAMTTYNGERYLREQLNSFAAQTRLPDELVVCDDGSIDSTSVILAAFAQEAPFPVRINSNEKNIGYARNFEKAVNLCTGDLIFLSDQDDVWFEKKLEIMTSVMSANPGVLVAINDTEIVRGGLEKTGIRKSRQFVSLGLKTDSFFTGCCTVIRSDIRTLFSPLPADWYAHDTWLHLLGGALGARLFVDEVLQYYRRSDDNASTWVGSSARKMRLWDSVGLGIQADSQQACTEGIEKLRVLEQRLTESAVTSIFPKNGPDRRRQALLGIGKRRKALERRAALLAESMLRRWLQALSMYRSGGYNHFSGWRSFVKDLAWWVGSKRNDNDRRRANGTE